jgi:hypothetical protein
MEELTQAQIARKAEIIKDIIKKRPDLNGCSYTSEKYYDYERNYERVRMIPSKRFFGYDPEELFTLGLNDPGYRLREAMFTIFDKGIQQKMNRFDDRISDPLRKFVSKIGIPGLYRVKTSVNSVGHVYAVTLEEASRVADVSYGFVVAGKKNRWGDPETLSVNFAKQGTVGDLNVSNQYDVGRIRERIVDAEATIEKQRALITKYETELMAIQMSELSQLDSSFEESAA